ncbi:unnamed protein product [Schistosoma mattheei]|uniref:Uncharacterized protein n=1 Tax=Schistosoma mattheei TaxID=31246 RepID=A0A183PP44_9TREM|nr:unnamed protein product [Schistosoma mattheei]
MYEGGWFITLHYGMKENCLGLGIISLLRLSDWSPKADTTHWLQTIDARQINLNQISSQFSTSSERLLNLLSLGDDNFTGITIPEEIASTLYLVRRLKLDLDIPAGFEKMHTLQNVKSERNLKLPGLNRIDCMENCSKQSSSNSSELIKTSTSDEINKTRVMKVRTSKKRPTTKPMEKNSTKGRQLPSASKNANNELRGKRRRIN